MKVLVIYANDNTSKVNELREELAEKFGKQTVLRLSSIKRKKSLIRHAWHRDAVRMMKLADIIVYAVSEGSITNKNVNWELKKARKLKKHIVCLPVKPGEEPNHSCLYETDPNTKEQVFRAELLPSKEKLFELIEKFNEDAYIELFHEPVDTQILMEQYRHFLETSENLVSRRQSVNSFYISANTALITIGGTIFALESSMNMMYKLIVIIALTLPGIVLNVSWHRMLQSYYINNRGKMKILSMIEKRLAASLYDAEWKAMKNQYSKSKYVSFTDNEKVLAWVFGAFYAVVSLFCIGALIF